MKYLARQDGASFYIYNGNDGLVATIAYPHRVRDFDMTRATQARAWFVSLMRDWGQEIYFEND